MSSPFLAWIIPVGVETPPPEGGVEPPSDAHPAHPIVLPGYPAHPIVLPPWIWGGGNEPFPTPPIALPPAGEKPPEIWGGGNAPFPTPPIVIPNPPDTKPPGGETGSPEHPINLPPGPDTDKGHWKHVFIPGVGWIWAWVPEAQMPPHPEQYKTAKKK